MPYNDYTWIYDVNWMATKGDERPLFHAFKTPEKWPDEPFDKVPSACGKTTTHTYGTKTPGAGDCEDCLKITGPDEETTNGEETD